MRLDPWAVGGAILPRSVDADKMTTGLRSRGARAPATGRPSSGSVAVDTITLAPQLLMRCARTSARSLQAGVRIAKLVVSREELPVADNHDVWITHLNCW